MRVAASMIATLAAAAPAWADLAPDPTNPATPDGAMVWLAVAAAVAALALIWFRRKR
jgi:hypothetical protein